MKQLLYEMQCRLADCGAREIEIIQPPDFYQPNQWHDDLIELGFEVRYTTNHYLVVDRGPLKPRMHLMERRKLARCRDFTFTLHPTSSLREVYHFIDACRKEREQSLSMTFDQLDAVVNKLADNFLLCTVESGSRWAAAAIIVKVSSKCWYQFYPAHSREFDKESPIVYLVSELFSYAAGQGVRFLDLGPSDLNGILIKGLVKFKERLGAVPGRKLIYSRSI
jgi:hypothetical protein